MAKAISYARSIRFGCCLKICVSIQETAVPENQLASFLAPLPEKISHNDFLVDADTNADQVETVPNSIRVATWRAPRTDSGDRWNKPWASLPTSDRRVPLAVQVVSVEKLDKYTRVKLFLSARSRRSSASLVVVTPTLKRQGRGAPP